MKVLVVDDSLLNLTIVEKYLKGFSKINEIMLCDKPEKVEHIIEENEIDILLLDVVMPVMTGFDILKMIRANNRHDDIYIIILTSLTDTESFKMGFELGAYDYINKPINLIEFNARIKVAIDLKINSNNLKKMISFNQQQYDRLSEANIKLKETEYQLVQSEKMAAIGQLAAGIAHEINNPMGFIKSNSEILSKYFTKISDYLNFTQYTIEKYSKKNDGILLSAMEEFNEKYSSLKIDTIVKEIPNLMSESKSGIDRVTEIVQAISAFAREAKDDETERSYYKLLETVNQIITIVKNETKYVADIKIDIPANMEIFCNKLQLGQVFINIIINAAQAIKSQNRAEKGTVIISAISDENYSYINISDDGPGIPKEILGKIFDPFFTTKDVGKGTGLGLSISYDLVRKHYGSLYVSSEVGKGTVFTIKLPKK